MIRPPVRSIVPVLAALAALALAACSEEAEPAPEPEPAVAPAGPLAVDAGPEARALGIDRYVVTPGRAAGDAVVALERADGTAVGALAITGRVNELTLAGDDVPFIVRQESDGVLASHAGSPAAELYWRGGGWQVRIVRDGEGPSTALVPPSDNLDGLRTAWDAMRENDPALEVYQRPIAIAVALLADGNLQAALAGDVGYIHTSYLCQQITSGVGWSTCVSCVFTALALAEIPPTLAGLVPACGAVCGFTGVVALGCAVADYFGRLDQEACFAQQVATPTHSCSLGADGHSCQCACDQERCASYHQARGGNGTCDPASNGCVRVNPAGCPPAPPTGLLADGGFDFDDGGILVNRTSGNVILTELPPVQDLGCGPPPLLYYCGDGVCLSETHGSCPSDCGEGVGGGGGGGGGGGWGDGGSDPCAFDGICAPSEVGNACADCADVEIEIIF